MPLTTESATHLIPGVHLGQRHDRVSRPRRGCERQSQRGPTAGHAASKGLAEPSGTNALDNGGSTPISESDLNDSGGTVQNTLAQFAETQSQDAFALQNPSC